MTRPTTITFTDTPPPGSQEEHGRAVRLIALLDGDGEASVDVHVLNHDGRELLISHTMTRLGPATSVETSRDGVVVTYLHQPSRSHAHESAACLAVNVLSRSTRTLRELLETR